MLNFTPVLTLEQSHEGAISDVTARLRSNQFRVVRSFDLQSACGYSGESPNHFCPHHPDQPCDCQLVVLLVYSEDPAPVTVIAHSNDGITQVGLSTSPSDKTSPALESRITNVLTGARVQKIKIRSLIAAKH